MLTNCDRFNHFDICIGDTARFPMSTTDFGRYARYTGELRNVYPYTWEVIAFGGAGKRHLILVRRRHDGLTRWIANHWFNTYANPYLKGGRYYKSDWRIDDKCKI